MQANVGRSGPATEAALQLAYENGADMLLLQEPGLWFHTDTQVYVPKSHPSFAVFVPQPTATKRPRAITYVREDRLAQLRVTQRQDLLAQDTADVVSIQIRGLAGPLLRVVNVYNAPRGEQGQAEGLRTVTGSRLSGDREAVIVAGDFNAHEATWATDSWNGRSNRAGRLLAEWMGTQGWVLGLEPGTATRQMQSRGGSALDLVFLSPLLQRLNWLQDCQVRRDLGTSSDHEVVWTELRARRQAGEVDEASKGRLSERRTDVETLLAEFEALRPTFEGFSDVLKEAVETGVEGNERRVDDLAEALMAAMQAALQASTPRSSGKRGGYVWWNAACAAAHAALLTAQQNQNASPRASRYEQRASRARKSFRQAVAKAKREWAKEKIDVLQGNDIFGAMRWSQGRRKYRSPPLAGEDGVMQVETEAKAETLRRALLPPPAPADLPRINLHIPNPKTVPDEPLTEQEIHQAVFEQDPKKAPGPDDVGFLTLRRLWPVAKTAIIELLGTALRVGWHPTVFRQATLVALKKAGDRDPAQPRSYRLVSLLPCLGKVLEKVVANILTYYAQSVEDLHSSHHVVAILSLSPVSQSLSVSLSLRPQTPDPDPRL
ncbi:hypothetical protein V8E36_003768 [Tilletia maclaganii]